MARIFPSIPHRPAVASSRTKTPKQSRGAAIIELAVCIPLLVMITLGTIEACAMIYLKQTLSLAAFEGCRVGLLPGSQVTNVESQAQLILNDHFVQQTNITMLPADPTTLQPGEFFRVTVAAECSPNSLIGGWFYVGRTFSESAELIYQ